MPSAGSRARTSSFASVIESHWLSESSSMRGEVVSKAMFAFVGRSPSSHT